MFGLTPSAGKLHFTTPLPIAALVAAAALSVGCGAQDPQASRLLTLQGSQRSVRAIESELPRILASADVAGLSCAVLNRSRPVYVKAFGRRDRTADALVTERTVFSAGSLSKPVFAYTVLRLVEQGMIDLDRPLEDHFGAPLSSTRRFADLALDPRHRSVSARMALSHTTGLPNWRYYNPTGRLGLMFEPGERFAYSGEGTAMLQMVVEHATGRSLEELAREIVFGPFAMERSAFEWQAAFEDDFARPHNRYGQPRRKSRRLRGQAAGSLQTTAGDYARFLEGVLAGARANSTLVEEMLRPQIAIESESLSGHGAWRESDRFSVLDLAWGLGWGRIETPYGRAFFHHGREPGFQAYTVCYVDRGVGVVLLSNSDRFEEVVGELVELLIGDLYSPFAWLGFPSDQSAAETEPPPAREAIDVGAAALVRCVGEYELIPDEPIMVEAVDGRLMISFSGSPGEELIPESEVRFFMAEDDTTLEFLRGAGGRIDGIRFSYGETELPAIARKVR